MNNHSNAEYLTLRQLFVAYARMLASREMFPAIRDFHEKRCRILTGLFEIQLQEPEGLAALAKCVDFKTSGPQDFKKGGK